MDNNKKNNRITVEQDEIDRLAIKIRRYIQESNDHNSLCHQSNVPIEFRCPISGEIMHDPVLLTFAKTYDRPSIERWLQYVLQKYPETQQVLSHAVLVPNQQSRNQIHQWCKSHVIQLSPPVNTSDRDLLAEFLNKLSSSTLSEKKQAANYIRILTKNNPSVCSYFCETPHAIPQLLDALLQSKNTDKDPDLQSDLVTVIFNISTDKNNKQKLGEHARVIPSLVDTLKHGTIHTRSIAAAALFTLSSLDSNKILIANKFALKPLVNLIAQGGENSEAMNNATIAMLNLCLAEENRGRAVEGGAVRVIFGKIKDGVINEGLLYVMALLATHQSGVEELEELGAVKCLLAVIRDGTTTELNREYCIVVLDLICSKNQAVPEEIRYEENANRTISMVAEQGTFRAKEIANKILDWLRKNTNTNLATTS